MKKDRYKGIVDENKFKAAQSKNDLSDLTSNMQFIQGLRTLLTSCMPTPTIEIEVILDRLDDIDQKIDSLFKLVNSMNSAFQRFDKIGLQMWQELNSSQVAPTKDDEPIKTKRQRVSKEEVKQRTLSAAIQMLHQDKKITLASVARNAGVTYQQAMYAWGSVDALKKTATS